MNVETKERAIKAKTPISLRIHLYYSIEGAINANEILVEVLQYLFADVYRMVTDSFQIADDVDEDDAGRAVACPFVHPHNMIPAVCTLHFVVLFFSLQDF